MLNKSQLNGKGIQLRNGYKYYCVDGHMINEDGYMMLKAYNDELEYCEFKWDENERRNWDIVAVYDMTDLYGFSDLLDFKEYNLVWARTQEKKKMTIDDIERELGYSIELVEDLSIEEKNEKIDNYCSGRACSKCLIGNEDYCFNLTDSEIINKAYEALKEGGAFNE